MPDNPSLSNCKNFRLTLITQLSNLKPWAEERMSGQTKKGLNSIVILEAWTVLKYCNRCVFDGASPNPVGALEAATEELLDWGVAGAKGIPFLCALAPNGE